MRQRRVTASNTHGAESAARARARPRGATLVATASATLRARLVEALASADGEVLAVPDLRAALALIALRDFAALLVELPTPGAGPAATIAAVRRAAPGMAVIALGADDSESELRRGLSCGAEAYVTHSDLSAGHLPRLVRDAVARARFHVADGAATHHALQALAAAADALLSVDRHGRVTHLNPAAEILTGWSRADAIGRAASEVLVIVDEASRRPAPDPLQRAMREDRSIDLTPGCVLLNRHGHEYLIEDACAPIHGFDGQVMGAVINFRELGRLRSAARKLAHRAAHDVLTNLPNRSLLAERVATALVLARRHQRRVALLYIDLDDFKGINDTLGHAAGDMLLIAVAQRMVAGVRASDTVSRQGGDEFVILLSEVDSQEDAEGSARKLLGKLAQAHDLGQRQITLTASIGISLYPRHGSEFSTLLRCADAAMYAAKRAGGNTSRVAHATQPALSASDECGDVG